MARTADISFDFAAYLGRYVDHGTTVTVQRLNGGLTNFTARATFDPPITRPSKSLIHSQSIRTIGVNPLVEEGRKGLLLHHVILKHARPYLAADPSQPTVGIARQANEASALHLLSSLEHQSFRRHGPKGTGGHPRQELGSGWSIRVPVLVFHDTVADVLWIEDLGSCRSISEVLRSVDKGYHFSKSMETIASQLAGFLVDLYSMTREAAMEELKKDGLKGMQWGESAINEHLGCLSFKVMKAYNIDDATELAQRVKDSLYQRDKEGLCLGMVDFWPENVLINREDGRCGLIDWEYFGISSPASELGMFGEPSHHPSIHHADTVTAAHMRLHVLRSDTTPEGKKAIQRFLEELFRAYYEATSKPSRYFKWRLLTCHGREMVNSLPLYPKLTQYLKRRIAFAGMRALHAA